MHSRLRNRPEPNSQLGDDPSDCRRRALDLLSRREHSRLELERKLQAKAFTDDSIHCVLDELEHSGYLDADRFTEAFVRMRAAKGQGPVRIRLELTERGIESCEEFLADQAYDWFSIASQARIKRFGRSQPKDYKDKAKQARFLQYRGFNFEHINRALEFGDESD